jgi:hypothetical protein
MEFYDVNQKLGRIQRKVAENITENLVFITEKLCEDTKPE